MAAGGRREAVGPGGGWERTRFEVAGVAIELAQDLKGSNSLRPLDDDRPGAADGGDADLPPPILTREF